MEIDNLMKIFLAILTIFLLPAIKFLLNLMVGGAIWDELKHQIRYRGFAQKVCHVILTVFGRLIPEDIRREVLLDSVAEVESLLVDKRVLMAILQSLGMLANFYNIRRTSSVTVVADIFRISFVGQIILVNLIYCLFVLLMSMPSDVVAMFIALRYLVFITIGIISIQLFINIFLRWRLGLKYATNSHLSLLTLAMVSVHIGVILGVIFLRNTDLGLINIFGQLFTLIVMLLVAGTLINIQDFSQNDQNKRNVIE